MPVSNRFGRPLKWRHRHWACKSAPDKGFAASVQDGQSAFPSIAHCRFTLHSLVLCTDNRMSPTVALNLTHKSNNHAKVP